MSTGPPNGDTAFRGRTWRLLHPERRLRAHNDGRGQPLSSDDLIHNQTNARRLFGILISSLGPFGLRLSDRTIEGHIRRT